MPAVLEHDTTSRSMFTVSIEHSRVPSFADAPGPDTTLITLFKDAITPVHRSILEKTEAPLSAAFEHEMLPEYFGQLFIKSFKIEACNAQSSPC
jgi:hypothetical protein